MAAGQGLCQWSHAPVTVAQTLQFRQYATQTVADCWAVALETWEAACGISFVKVIDDANITARSGAIDGPGRILAQSHLPCGANETTALSQLYDSSEVWPSRAYLTATMIHELGHALGLDHSQDPLNIMYPSMRPNVMALGSGDIAQAQRRYGLPRQQPTPTPQPIPTPTPTGNPILTIDGRRFEVAGRWL
jgi:predicted Zn-dependent protease